MKHLLISLALLSPTSSQELTDVDRDLLLDKLKEIQESANKAAKGRFANAVTAFRAAAASDIAANELYLQCVEKVDFQDEARKARDFREWKKRHKDRRDSPGFRRALRYQLKWLLATIEISQDPSVRAKMPETAISAIETILADADLLKGNANLLQQSVLSSYFARAYDLSSLQVENWVLAPFNITSLYNIVILPPWQNSDTISMLEKGWNKRIEHTGLALKYFTEEGEKDRIPAFEKWHENERLEMIWDKEKDLFTYGNQRTAALRMLAHVKTHLDHPRAPSWVADFTVMVKKEDAPAEKVPELSQDNPEDS
ncbi:MAG: hypothetical protein ACON5H_09805 [Akkermansiaceae bacterium]